MCYCCNLCNRCGRADEMKDKLGKRLCMSCGAQAFDKEALICPSCGATLPPKFPDLPVGPGKRS